MGLMTNITIANDCIHEIEENPEKWWKEIIYPQICSSRGREQSNHYGTTINSVEHSSTTTILAVGGNYTTILGYSSAGSHHTEEGQVVILKELAQKLGYKLIKNKKEK